MDKKVSVIMPVYNSSNYLRTCLDSVVSQTYSNFEIVLVDDGSTDGSQNICDEYASIFNNINVYHIDNKGVSNARNFGISKAKGELVTFVDADDWVEKDILENLVSMINDYDLSCCSLREVWPHINTKNLLINSNYQLDNPKDAFDVINRMHKGVTVKLFRKEIIINNNIKFNEEIKNGEDAVFLYEYLMHANSFVTSSKIVYNYNKIDSNTAVTKYYEDYYKWKLIELKASFEAFDRWSNNKQDTKQIKINNTIQYIEEMFDYYFSNCSNPKQKILDIISMIMESKLINISDINKNNKYDLKNNIENTDYEALYNAYECANKYGLLNIVKQKIINVIKSKGKAYKTKKYSSQ